MGRLAGEMLVKMAAGEPTVRLMVTTVTVAGVLAVPGGPQVNVTVPEKDGTRRGRLKQQRIVSDADICAETEGYAGELLVGSQLWRQ